LIKGPKPGGSDYSLHEKKKTIEKANDFVKVTISLQGVQGLKNERGGGENDLQAATKKSGSDTEGWKGVGVGFSELSIEVCRFSASWGPGVKVKRREGEDKTLGV